MRLRRPRQASVGDGADGTDPVVVAASSGTPSGARPTPLADPEFVAGLRAVPSGLGDAPVSWPASDLSGVRPDGSPLGLELDAAARPLLLVFLSTNCQGCDLFWNGLRGDLSRDVDVMVVTKGPEVVDSREVAALSSALPVPVVMSDAAWVEYRVTSYPFLVLVEPRSRRVVGERVAFGWSDIDSLLAGSGGE